MASELLLHVESFDYRGAESLDPLLLDSELAQLPRYNTQTDIDSLLGLVRLTVSRLDETALFDQASATAALRDIDFVAGSLVRHGINPIAAAPGLEGHLLKLGVLADMVPRGNVFTYAGINPTDKRRRTFTDLPEERAFIDAVRESLYPLELATRALGRIELADGGLTAAAPALELAGAATDRMVASIVAVRRAVPPEVFTYQLRPFFDPIVIGGRNYLGAGGAQMQLLAIDRIAWGIDDPDPAYQGFYDENYAYLMPVQREALREYQLANGQRSLITQARTEAAVGRLEPAGAQPLVDLLKVVRRFRYPHKKVADDNFKLRSGDAVGSGSYRPDILATLIARTEEHLASLEELTG